MQRILSTLRNGLHTYRYDLIALTIMLACILAYAYPLFSSGMVVFSDIAFGLSSDRYIEEIFGAWNERWSTTTLLNVPRLVFIAPLYGLSLLFGASGPFLIKSFILTLLIVSALSMYALVKRLHSIYITKHFQLMTLMTFTLAGLLYALNPWIITRIQHIYLLCGYALFPFALLLFFNLFDPKFRRQLDPDFSFNKRLSPRIWIDAIGLSVTFMFMSAGIHYFFFSAIYMGIMLVLIVLKTLWTERKTLLFKSYFFYYVRLITAVGFVFILFNGYWFFMYVGSILFGAQASQHNINVTETLMLFSRNSSIENVLYTISYWWPMFDLHTLPLTFWVAGGILLFFIGIGLLGSYKRPIHLFFGLLGIGLIIFATGTYEWVATAFVALVTYTPLIGPMFRDPNKLVGLLIVSYSLLLSLGIGIVDARQSKAIPRPLYRGILFIGSFVALTLFIYPYRTVYMEGFYKPVDVPEEYATVQQEIDGKWLQFPVADEMTQPITGVATPRWNENPALGETVKPTGDFHVYSSLENTVFHHEGSTPAIRYLFSLLQYLLDTGRSDEASNLIKVFGVDQFAYRDEYLGMEERQQFNLDILASQRDLLRTKQVGLFTLFDVVAPLTDRTVPQLIVTPYGIDRSITYGTIPGYEQGKQSILFTTQRHSEDFDWIRPGDAIEMIEQKDMLLSQVPDDYYWKPFEAIDSANPFLTWGKTLFANSDWRWYQQTQGVKDPAFDLDFGDGVGLSFASARIDAPPYELDDLSTKQVASFNSMLEDETFFKADNPDIVDLSPNPLSSTNDLPLLQAEVAKGDPNYIWQVAKSGLLPALPNNAYRFDIVASGRGVDRLHVKVRFFDASGEEIDQSYVVAPRDSGNLDGVHLRGEYVTPRAAETMRIDLLSYQKPERKTYWWIHDVQIESFESHMVPNTFSITKETPPGRYIGFARVLMNQSGGQLDVTINDDEQIVETTRQTGARLEWVPLGIHDVGTEETTITVENTVGFNAIQNIVFLPEEEWKTLQQSLQNVLEPTNTFMVLEGEQDFDYSGTIQSERNYPSLSFGKGVSLTSGTLSRTIDVAEPGDYRFHINLTPPVSTDGTIRLRLLQDEEVVQEETIGVTAMQQLPDVKTDIGTQTVTYDSLRRDFPYQLQSLEDVHPTLKRWTPNTFEMEPGSYTLELTVDSNVPSRIELEDLRKFDPNEIVVTEPLATPEAAATCATCVSITDDMFESTVEDDTFIASYEPTCSCDWYIFASEQIEALPDREYLVAFDARSEQIRNRHVKMYYLDEERRVIGTDFISEVEEYRKSTWNHYEQILIPPKGTDSMQLHIWARGNVENAGRLEMKNLNVVRYDHLLLTDQVTVEEVTERPLLATTEAVSLDVTRSVMKRTVSHEDSLGRFTLNDSPSPLFELSTDEGAQRGEVALNGVTQLYMSSESNVQVNAVLRLVYFAGMILLLLATPVSFFFYWNARQEEPLLQRVRHRFKKG
ncbi:7TM-DISM domain-containing protein [Exiguobacterium sp. CH10]|uniref:7TM-DISM domain-containing protein n=1 Tax=Exiguobacterium sp. CH10 TaxID=2751261 RepID=UPI001BED1275|nr:7TM-DISM domain-containing protein [Exiguobacterium sp. CH10]